MIVKTGHGPGKDIPQQSPGLTHSSQDLDILVGELMGLWQVVQGKALGSGCQLLTKFALGLGAPVLGTVQENLNGIDLGRVISHKTGKSSQ